VNKPKLLELERRVLVDLAVAFKNGTLKLPVTEAELRAYAGDASPVAAAEVVRLQDLGMREAAIAETLSLLGESLRAVEKARDEVEFVWSGPERGVTQTRETSVVVEDLFGSAEREVLLATYAVYDGRSVFKTLAERMEAMPDLRVRFFVHIGREDHERDKAEAEVLHRFAREFRDEHWPEGARLPELFYDPRTLLTGPTRASLHAKCIVVDDERAFVTSANFTEAAQQRNIEAGVHVENGQFARALRGQFDMLVGRKLVLPLKMAAA
jgi:phosphatidylserine/phosphatidylglycerophosphate/cardiolipin synthase-like enzyme